ncbi:hypothetical protein SteCoe_33802 [Stentor coeruleus]|uniref:Uncharacterized protein n=1 Tax=Stentor coeruleus TaxID=5963 RepID=A0A1R2AVZ8_9CILI|nr:hypothetical protein SteCoe_33802 [Stentor coeruleus]
MENGINFDSISKEEKFNEFYDEFFKSKLVKFIKNIKGHSFLCSSNCITDFNINASCLQACQDPCRAFFTHVEKVLKDKIQTYEKCTPKCLKNNNPEQCIDQCIELTLKDLRSIDADKEFNKFLK